MNREQFYAAMAGMDGDRLRKVLWTLYWRSAAPVRQRVEAELAPEAARPRTREAVAGVDPDEVLGQVQQFVALARAGSYLSGDRRVSPKERTRWRFTFRRLVADARQALRDEDIGPGVTAVTEMVDLACEVGGYDYFRSDDPWRRPASWCRTRSQRCGSGSRRSRGSLPSPATPLGSSSDGKHPSGGPAAATAGSRRRRPR